MTRTPPSRRAVLHAAAALPAVALLPRPAAAQEPVPFSAGTEKPKLAAPPNAADCHFHIYDSRFPPAPGGLPAPDASPADYRKLQARIGTTRGVVVQPSLYGVDNRPTLEGMAALGPNFRAVAVVNTSVTDAELQRLHGLGVRGIRFNLVQAGATTLEMLEPLSQRVAPLGWHCQIHMLGDQIAQARELLLRLPSRVVFDHRGRIPQPAGPQHPAFGVIAALMQKGNGWVKLSGLYMDTKVGPPTYADSVALARALFAAGPQRCVWGSDWPHPTEAAGQKPDDAVLFDLLGQCVPDEAARRRVLVDNPAELYDFPKG